MIRSMTGFGRAGFEVEGVAFEVEVRTLNHRFLDVRVKLPRFLASLETEVRLLVQSRLRRGKAEVAVRGAEEGSAEARVEVALDLAAEYFAAARELQRRHGISGILDVGTLLRLPGVARLVERELPSDAVAEALRAALGRAIEAMDAMRAAEGAALARELEQGLARIDALIDALEARAGQVQEAVRERLRKRTEQLREETGLLDEARLHQEIVWAADRLDVSEELSRLRSHGEQFRRILAEETPEHPAGRRLTFLLQEMGREANTIGAKSADAPLALDVVELKSELERLREQVQNVE